MGQFIASDSVTSSCGALTGVIAAEPGLPPDVGPGFTIVNSNGKREFLIDVPRYLLEWRDAGFPTTGISTLPDGTPFTVRFTVQPSALAAGTINVLNPVRGIRQVATNTLGVKATMTATFRVLIDDTWGGSPYSAVNSDWWVEGTYVSSVDGSVKTFSTQGSGGAVAADTQAWTALTFAPFSGGARTYLRYKFEAALTNVAAGSDVSARVVCAKPPSTLTEWCFIDPQPVLT